MQLITEISGRQYYVHLINEGPLDVKVFKGRPFILLIHYDNKNSNLDLIKSIAEDLLKNNLRYVMSVGTMAEQVESLFDEIISKKFAKEKLVVTTSHENESIHDVVFYLVNLTHLPDISPEFCLLLFLEKNAFNLRFIERLKES